MAEVGIDISGQRPKRLGVYLGRGFCNYLVIVCDRAMERCSRTFTGVGVRSRAERPPSDEGLPYDSMPERFRRVREGIEIGVKDWLENPEAELERLREGRERDRRQRLAGGRPSSRAADRGPGWIRHHPPP